MKTSLRTLVLSGCLFLSGGGFAAECQLRNLSYVGVTSDAGYLIINAEMWDAIQGRNVGWFANTPLCSVQSSFGSISQATCQAWYSSAMSAMMANKRVYLNPSACNAGNPAQIENYSLLGINH